MNRDNMNIDWANLPFGYFKTDCNIRFYHRDGKWSAGELVTDETITMHMAAPCLHYGQEAFEGMKAFQTRDGRIVIFRPSENWKRLQKTSERIFLPPMPEEMFVEAVKKVVAANIKYVPPYGTGASLYIRPFLIGVGAKVGLGPAPEYIFAIFVTPVGPYYKGGLTPVKAMVITEFDRAAPDGVGDCKVGGNYAAGLPGADHAKQHGYPVPLFLDPKEKKYVDEFGTSNFIAIKGDTYYTPSSKSILPSITNDSLRIIAADLGMKIERRPISIDEVSSFDEVGAVGTAAVITPICGINYQGKEMLFGSEEKAGPVITKLYQNLTGIQYGELEDKFNWLVEVR
ncbi:MAG TPA: branched-chain amino acid aminotransferase [Spirochaetota bacterium]|nr:branched-chain amino acid aminotransferase [Spirochaetota bacterium]HPF04690.1 branched-chain amino acid aminotransferase [Spirochaetota bacterium]HPJ41947.1 branched-chain amino acid aminotransferase [Spirochaetota bacterium]HPR37328.1 branched-chain amino acid aminotransferase [Spirochaetota bacterium]HRX46449.1 branched-chain amino acid aminotransferase [Spirochaetota bacterium]